MCAYHAGQSIGCDRIRWFLKCAFGKISLGCYALFKCVLLIFSDDKQGRGGGGVPPGRRRPCSCWRNCNHTLRSDLFSAHYQRCTIRALRCICRTLTQHEPWQMFLACESELPCTSLQWHLSGRYEGIPVPDRIQLVLALEGKERRHLTGQRLQQGQSI